MIIETTTTTKTSVGDAVSMYKYMQDHRYSRPHCARLLKYVQGFGFEDSSSGIEDFSRAPPPPTPTIRCGKNINTLRSQIIKIELLPSFFLCFVFVALLGGGVRGSEGWGGKSRINFI